jgi:hypothetical protein
MPHFLLLLLLILFLRFVRRSYSETQHAAAGSLAWKVH